LTQKKAMADPVRWLKTRTGIDEANKKHLYKVIFPDGHTEETTGFSIKSFCVNNNLSYSGLRESQQHIRDNTHKGFKLVRLT
jgi:hypothetical protein